MPAFNSIDGLASGLNTTEIINALIQAERRPAVFLEQQRDENTNIVSVYKAFQAKLLALSTDARILSRVASFEKSAVDISDDSYLSVTASGRTSVASYDLQVLSLARNHQIASQGFEDESAASLGAGTIQIGVGDGSVQTITVDSSNNSLVGIKQAINNAKMGVTASIVNDGTDSNAYRLMLASDKTGAANKITVDVNLSGGDSLNFSTASFDVPEESSFAATTDVQVSLGTTAAYSGSTNKTYTLTVAGTGAQTIGEDTVQIDWSDGVNSGSIVVTQADTEVELVGAGADGLKLNFSAGQFSGGDSFTVSTFAPLLQEASDARLAIGSTGGNGSPITVTSETNSFNQVISGLSITARKVTGPSESVTVNTDIDTEAVKGLIQGLLDKINDASKFVDDQNKYDPETKQAGLLLGDSSLQLMQSQLRRSISNVVPGLSSKYNQLATIGIRTNAQGQLTIADSGRLEDAIRNNLDDVVNLFTDSGNSSSEGIRFISSTSDTRIGQNYEVNITQAATRGTLAGQSMDSPSVTPITLASTTNRLKLKVDGVESEELVLTARTYNSASDLVKEIQDKIDADSNIGTRGVTVEWVGDELGTGYLLFTGSTYGSKSLVELASVSNDASPTLGLADATATAGKDVAGTINGEAAEGIGQYLTGKDDNETTADLKLRITLNESQITDGVEGTISIARGIASRLSDTVDSLSQAGDGMLDRRIKGVQNQITFLQQRIDEFDARLALRRESLYKKFYAMEQALGNFSAIGDFLTGQLSNINVNWKNNS
jgi:flagellar hook-associated protein 2